MMPKELMSPEFSDAVDKLTADVEPFAVATIVRTAGSTAAKPGAKALLDADGAILRGWLGGGCTRGAVKRAVVQALQDGQPKFVSVAPEDSLSAQSVTAGDEVDGVVFARNGCPSEGTIDIFIEPVLPLPSLTIFGGSPVAEALSALAPRFQWDVKRLEGSEMPEVMQPGRQFVVVATQGQGDRAALSNALKSEAAYVSFVGSRKKFAALARQLVDENIPGDRIEAVKAPAGLDIGAVTPEEIALSILAELTQERRNVLREQSFG